MTKLANLAMDYWPQMSYHHLYHQHHHHCVHYMYINFSSTFARSQDTEWDGKPMPLLISYYHRRKLNNNNKIYYHHIKNEEKREIFVIKCWLAGSEYDGKRMNSNGNLSSYVFEHKEWNSKTHNMRIMLSFRKPISFSKGNHI